MALEKYNKEYKRVSIKLKPKNLSAQYAIIDTITHMPVAGLGLSILEKFQKPSEANNDDLVSRRKIKRNSKMPFRLLGKKKQPSKKIGPPSRIILQKLKTELWHEQKHLESLQTYGKYTERDVVRIFTPQKGYQNFISLTDDGCNTEIRILTGKDYKKLPGTVATILKNHLDWQGDEQRHFVSFDLNAHPELSLYHPSIQEGPLHYRAFGPWHSTISKDMKSIIKYHPEKDPRVKKLPIYATPQEIEAALRKNPFKKDEKDYEWRGIKRLVNDFCNNI